MEDKMSASLIWKKGCYSSIWEDLSREGYNPATFGEVSAHIEEIDPGILARTVKLFNRIIATPQALFVEHDRCRDIHYEEREAKSFHEVLETIESKVRCGKASKILEPFRRNHLFSREDLLENKVLCALAGSRISNLRNFLTTHQLDIYLASIEPPPSYCALNFPKLRLDEEKKVLMMYVGGYLASYDDFEEFGIGIRRVEV